MTDILTETADDAVYPPAGDEEMIILGENLTDRELLNQIVKEIKELRESHERILALVAEIKNKVEPTIEALSNSPILKMMGVK